MLQFRDCPHCGKRIRFDATLCHRCQKVIVGAMRSKVPAGEDTNDADHAATEHFATGGYDYDGDDFDDEDSEEKIRRNRRHKLGRVWKMVAWLMVGLLLATYFLFG